MADLEQDLIIARIKNRRGNRVDLPQPLAPGELGFAMDTKQLFIGIDSENTLTGIDLHLGKTTGSQLTVNQDLENIIIEFDTRPEQLNRNRPPAADPNGELYDEPEVLAQLFRISSTDYVRDRQKTEIETAESNVKLLADTIDFIDQVMLTQGIGSDYKVLYDWTAYQPADIDLDKVYVDTSTTYDKTTEYYVFTFHIAVTADTVDAAKLSVISSDLNATIVRIDNSENLGNETTNIGAESMAVRGKEMINGYLFLPTARQSNNVAAIINEYSLQEPTDLVNTKQNIELLTEFVDLKDSPDEIITNYISYVLIPNTPTYNATLPPSEQLPPEELYDPADPLVNGYTPIADKNSLPLVFNISESDSININYSVVSQDELYREVGTSLVVASQQFQTSRLSNKSTNIRDASLPDINDGGPALTFKSVYNTVNNTVELKYRHDFTVPVILKLTIQRWSSK